MRRCLIAAVVLVSFAMPSVADVKLHPLFADRGVLQRGRAIPVWGTADAGSNVSIAFRKAKATAKADEAGRWKVELPAQTAGGPDDLIVESGETTITIKDILVGEVWICSGQSNMGWTMRQSANAETNIAAASHPNLRLFVVPLKAEGTPQTSVVGSWRECTPDVAANFSAVAYFFGRDLHKHLNVPVGLIQTAWGGTPAQAWTSDEALAAEPSLKHYSETMKERVAGYDPVKAKEAYDIAMEKHKEATAKAKEESKSPPPAPRLAGDPRRNQNSPSTLYNAMIAPLIPYGVAGAIWYQGESNGSRGYEYRTLFTTVIKDWRTRWGQGDFPFLCVQLAPFNNGNTEGPQWAELREAQYLATKTLPKVGMAVITDVGEKDDIHPPQKEPVGHRLALLAQRIAYGESLVADGPLYRFMKVEGNSIVLNFDSVGTGLEAKGGELTGFTICGSDNKFVPAQAEIRGDTVVVRCDSVDAPVAVRYGWKNYCVVNLFNKNGLPATPFRTDDLPLVSGPRP